MTTRKQVAGGQLPVGGVNAEHVGVHNEEIKLVWEGGDVAGIDFDGRGQDVLLVRSNGHNSAACEPKDQDHGNLD